MQPVTIIVDTEEKFSSIKFPGQKSITYQLSADGNQQWCDWFIKTSPKGYWNPLASVIGLRMKNVKCFCLCGCYNDDISTAFAIGEDCQIIADQDGYLSFFANDSDNYYNNNRGSIGWRLQC
ncbi:hypothetical protein [Dyadobacter sp. 32]|uniref:hypothetical protein n=1 Tax=Dyadobacter sp. 32 TaxID=538966 RepID=UPI0011ECC6BA